MANKKQQPLVIKKKGEKEVKREIVKLDKLPKTPEELNERQKAFCRFYLYDWNGKRAAIKAGYAPASAHVYASQLLVNPNIKSYIDSIKNNLEERAGISRDRVLAEYASLAFSSIAKYHNTWIEKKEFEKLTTKQKAAIQSIEYRTRKYTSFDDGSEDGQEVEVEEVKIRLFDKVRALEAISRMLGYDAPTRVQAEVVGAFVIQTVDNKEQGALLNEVVKMLKEAEK